MPSHSSVSGPKARQDNTHESQDHFPPGMKNCRSSLIFFFLAQNCLAVTQGILESCRIQVYKPPEQGITSECYLNLVLLNKIVSWLLGSLLLPL